MIKNIKISKYIGRTLLLGLATTALLGSCKRTEDDLFSQTAIQRADDVIRTTREILVSAPNGWDLQIYPSAERTYGGYNILVKFDNQGRVQALTELQARGTTPTEGAYVLNNSNGPTISFTTYVRGVHLYSEPNSGEASFFDLSSPNDRILYVTQGARGDYAYQIVSASADSVVLRGVRSGSLAKLVPASSESWTEQRNAYETATELFEFDNNANLSVGGKTYPFYTKKRHIYITVDGTEISVPFVFNQNGLTLYQPIELGGKILDRLTRVKRTDYSGLENSDGSIRVVMPNYNPAQLIENGLWYLDVDQSKSDYIAPALKDIKNLGTNAGLPNTTPLLFAVLGKLSIPSNDSGFGFWPTFYGKNISQNDMDITYRIPYTLEILGTDEIKLTYDASQIPAEGVSSEVLNSYGLKSPGRIFSQSLGEKVENPNRPGQYAYPWGAPPVVGNTYKIVVDDLGFPTKLTLTNTNNANEVLVLVKARPYYTETE